MCICMYRNLGKRKREQKGRGEGQREKEERRRREGIRNRERNFLKFKFVRVGKFINYLYSCQANLESTKRKFSTNVINY